MLVSRNSGSAGLVSRSGPRPSDLVLTAHPLCGGCRNPAAGPRPRRYTSNTGGMAQWWSWPQEHATLKGPRDVWRSRLASALVVAGLLSALLATASTSDWAVPPAPARIAAPEGSPGRGCSRSLSPPADPCRCDRRLRPVYQVRGEGSALTASSPAQRLSSSFSSTGVSVRSRHTSLNMRLAAAGYGSSLRPVARPRHGERQPRTYAHAGLEEWYANGPLGLEQGFTLARAPSGAQRGPLTLAVSLAGSAHASLSSDGQSVDFGSSAGG